MGIEYHPPLHIGVVAIERGAFRLPSTMGANFIYYLFTLGKKYQKMLMCTCSLSLLLN